MRIYAAADIHGRASRIESVKEQVKKLAPDVVVLAGDITNSFADVRQLKDVPVPVLAIRGNWDMKKVDKWFDHFSLHLKTVIISGVPFIGVGGAVSLRIYSRLAVREQTMIRRIESLLTKDSILVVHPPPHGVLDEVFKGVHGGCRRLYDMILRLQPPLMICGHVHKCPGSAFIGKTLVVNCSIGKRGAGALITYEKGQLPIVEMML
jgi:Icc-related predicted phosphoesterase